MGLLKNVRQMGFEFHKILEYPRIFSQIIVDLHRLGFKVISYDPNLHVLPKETNFFSYSEIVFKKS